MSARTSTWPGAGTGARARLAVAVAVVLTCLAGLGATVNASLAASTSSANATAAAAEPVNVALVGEPAASYTAAWNTLEAVNDGAGVSTGGAHGATWGTYGQNPRPATQWLEYSWPAPVTVDRSVVRFWSDGADANGDNVRVPQSWTIQYWDAAAGAFADLPEPSGFPVARLEPNETTFDAVSTTRLRATFSALPGGPGSTFSAVGVSEWEVWGSGGVEEPEPVDPHGPIDVAPVHVPTPVGVLPDLPAKVDAVFVDGRVERVAVDWQEVTADDVAQPGALEVTGTTEAFADLVRGTVHVRAGEPGAVVGVDPVSVVTLAGVAPVLSPVVTAAYEDGSRDSRTEVSWGPVAPADYAEPGGFFLVPGTVAGTDLEAEAVVFVLAPDDVEDTLPPTVTITAEPGPTTSGWIVTHPEVVVVASDNRDPSPAVEISVDDGAWTPYAGPFAVDQDGVRTVRARATDEAGNVGEAVRELRVDTVAPVTTATVRDLGAGVEITLEATDAGSGVDRIQWEGPGTFWGTYSEPFTRALTDEVQVIEFAATDAAGNVEERGRLELPARGEGLDVDVVVTPRCLAGTVHVAVRATNAEDVPLDVELSTPYGNRSVPGVAPGRSAYQSFTARAASVDGGDVAVTATAGGDPTTVSVAFPATDCG
ncbi:Ig-like domain-containing protein [Oerskovia flava]|uniref:Ig-like domain-containing protein n=1 Tax=Oerskovia flava TaxID=2986422 RepID=UPI00223FA607|nr:Ig-like domain-containing protein [Oerskovia sp. JB1-3-2]